MYKLFLLCLCCFAAAQENNIVNIRKGWLTINFNGAKEVSEISLNMTRHAFPFGTAYSPEQVSDPGARKRYVEMATRLFNALVPENLFKWPNYEPCRGCVGASKKTLDESYFPLAVKQDMVLVRGHTLEWYWRPFAGHWSRGSGCIAYESYLKERIIRDVKAFQGKFHAYDVINELLHEPPPCDIRAGGRNSLLVKMFVWANQADPMAQLCINEYNVLDGGRTRDYVTLVKWMLDNGAPVHCLGVQSHIAPVHSAADLVGRLDLMATLGLPIYITEVSVYSGWSGGLRNTLSEQQQADYLKLLVSTLFGHPAVHGIMFWGFWDGNHWIRNGGFYRMDFSPKASGRVLENMIFREWWTTIYERNPTLNDNVYSFYGFYGRYVYKFVVDGVRYEGCIDFTGVESGVRNA